MARSKSVKAMSEAIENATQLPEQPAEQPARTKRAYNRKPVTVDVPMTTAATLNNTANNPKITQTSEETMLKHNPADDVVTTSKQKAANMHAARTYAKEHLPKLETLLHSGRATDVDIWGAVAGLRQNKAHHSELKPNGEYPSFTSWIASKIGVDEFRSIAPMIAIAEYDELSKAYMGEDGAPLSKRTCADIARMWPNLPAVKSGKNVRNEVTRVSERMWAIRVAQTLGRYAWDAFLVGAKVDAAKQGSEGKPIVDLKAWYEEQHEALEAITTKESAKSKADEYRLAAIRSQPGTESPNAAYLIVLRKQFDAISASIEGFQKKANELFAQIETLEESEKERIADLAAQNAPTPKKRGRPAKITA